MTRASHSFFAAFAGWLAAIVGYLAWQQAEDGHITDFAFTLFWPLAVTFAGWLVVGLPLALWLGDERIRRLGLVVGVATTATLATWAVIVAALDFPLTSWVWWPLAIGVVGGATLWLLEQRRPFRSWVCWVVPLAFFPAVRYGLLPIGVRWFPYTTYVVGKGVIGPEAELAVIRTVKVGDTYDDLHRRYPAIFDAPYLSTTNDRYTLAFDALGGRVTRVEIRGATE